MLADELKEFHEELERTSSLLDKIIEYKKCKERQIELEQQIELEGKLINKALTNKLIKMAGSIESYKDELKTDLKTIKDVTVLFNGIAVGKCTYINSTEEIDGATKIISNYIEMESYYEWEYSLNPIKIYMVDTYGRVIKDIIGYLTQIESQGNNKVAITIKQELKVW